MKKLLIVLAAGIFAVAMARADDRIVLENTMRLHYSLSPPPLRPGRRSLGEVCLAGDFPIFRASRATS